MAIVYGLHAGDNVIRYVGMTARSAKERFREHIKHRNANKHFPVYDWMRKYGDEIQIVILQSYETRAEASKGEVAFIKELGFDNLLNCTYGGEGVTYWSDEARAKMSKTKSNQSLETREKIAKAKTGKTLSKEHKEKLRKARLGYVHSDKTKAKMSKAKQNQSPETREKISNAQKARHAAGFYGKKGN